MRFYIGKKLTPRQQWIWNKLEDGLNEEEIFIQSKGRGCNRLIDMRKEIQEVLDLTDFQGRSHPDSIVLTSHAYARLIERYDGLVGWEIEEMVKNMLTMGQSISYNKGERKISYNDLIWVISGNRIITIFRDIKSIRAKVGA